MKSKITLHPLAQTQPSLPGSTTDPLPPLDTDLAVLLERSLQHLIDARQTLATTFYAKLFAAHPSLRAMFPAEMSDQGKKLTDTLAWIATNMSNRSTVLPALSELGQRHVKYGVKPEHYPIVASLLSEAMTEVGGESFPPEAQKAWRTALQLICDHMFNSSSPESSNRPE